MYLEVWNAIDYLMDLHLDLCICSAKGLQTYAWCNSTHGQAIMKITTYFEPDFEQDPCLVSKGL